MIHHIVMFKVNNGVDPVELKTRLEALPPQIKVIRRFEVGINSKDSPAAAHVVLLSSFDTHDDLATYANHPAHQEVVAYIKANTTERRVVDYED